MQQERPRRLGLHSHHATLVVHRLKDSAPLSSQASHLLRAAVRFGRGRPHPRAAEDRPSSVVACTERTSHHWHRRHRHKENPGPSPRMNRLRLQCPSGLWCRPSHQSQQGPSNAATILILPESGDHFHRVLVVPRLRPNLQHHHRLRRRTASRFRQSPRPPMCPSSGLRPRERASQRVRHLCEIIFVAVVVRKAVPSQLVSSHRAVARYQASPREVTPARTGNSLPMN